MSEGLQFIAGTAGGGGAPSGPAGGDLTGTYPNPTLAVGVDAAAGVGSRRTLGFGALQAMPGNTAIGGSESFATRSKWLTD